MAPCNLHFYTVTALLAILATSVALAQATELFKEETKTCHPDCTKLGNCNGETGQCECPFGLTGPNCSDRLFPACHSSTEPGSLPHYGIWYPKNCYCAKQLRQHPYSCPDYLKFEGGSAPYLSPCFYDILMENNLLCYRYKSLPESAQLSDSPPMDHPDLEWVRMAPYPNLKERVLAGEEVPKEYKTPDQGTWLPLSKCPNNCSHRGWCQVRGGNHAAHHHADDQIWCACHSYFSGASCEKTNEEHCFRNCSGVGTCLGGWCHCQPGYWGHGCTRRKAYTSTVGWRPNPAEAKIYVYDLPTEIIHRREFNDQWAIIDTMYNSELEFTEQLLADWSVRTENPWEATFFFVPLFTYWYTGNVGHPYYIIQHVTHHLQRIAPFFNLTAGRNHIMWATNDRGACKLQHASPEMQHSIKVVHFGQSPRRPYLFRTHLPGSTNSVAEMTALPQPGHRFKEFPEFGINDIIEEREYCFRPEKDVAAPNYLHLAWVNPDRYSKVWSTTFLPDGSRLVTRRPDAPERNTTLFFGGYSKKDMWYSQGVRQALHKMFGSGGKYDPAGPNARPDFLVTQPHPDAPTEMQRAKFCLAPMGAGWGIRLTEAMVCGCVPVIIQDHVYQALWDVVPFEDFSIRISRHDLHLLVELLDMVTPQQLERLQAGVERYHRAFYWDTQFGGLAYNYTITAIRRRAVHLWSVNYRRHRRHLLSEQQHGQQQQQQQLQLLQHEEGVGGHAGDGEHVLALA
ncbi:hypothetical protein Agub_g11762 [Astrephomene gubernaculifera]|uniref:EGF-like domain-containing protein n=1 Tax=Astrephomene gubernaculifera TaxID=47775 RepID=A0AAD3HR61_9CHLO|nr:hypothetical protein Agub_g11762 [Astrephomene gubernaculifera]